MHQNGKAAQEGGRITERARLSLEEKTGQKGGLERELPAACLCEKAAFLNLLWSDSLVQQT